MSRNKNKSALYMATALVILLTVFLTIAGSIVVTTVLATTPDWDSKSLQSDMTTFIYDNEGGLLASLHGAENRVPVSIKDIPKHVQQAFIAIEDARFYQHKGVDLRAIARAAIANIRNNKVVEGGSTITQQLVKNSFLTSEKTLDRKIKEALLAYDIEKKYTKDEILEFYLNRVYFGHGVYGVQSASKLYFDKDVKDLTLTEGALLAGLVRSPNGYSPYNYPDKAVFRMETVLVLMEQQGYIDRQKRKIAEKEGYHLADLDNQDVWRHPFFVDYVIDYMANNLNIPEDQIFRCGFKIYTTLDPKIQTVVEDTLLDDKNFPQSKPDQMIQGAMTVIDYRTGEVKALVGGRKHEAKRGFNRATQMRRQPGSSFKPIVAYAPALEQKYPTNLILNDAETTFANGYIPKNANGRFLGPITMRTAIKHSINVYAVKLLDLVGVENGYNFAKKLGIKLTETDKVLPIALGGLTYGVTPLEMARAFGTFANGGVLVDSTPVNKIVDNKNKVIVEVIPKKSKVMSKQTSYLITDLLQDVVNGGTATAAQMNRPVAGKTGTAQVPNTKEFNGLGRAHKDAWFVGYTPELVASVWVGYDITDRNHYITIYGGNNPARIWKTVMSQVLKDVPVKKFETPNIKFEYKQGANAGVEIMTAEEKQKLEAEKLKQEEEEKRLKEEQAKAEEQQKQEQEIKQPEVPQESGEQPSEQPSEQPGPPQEALPQVGEIETPTPDVPQPPSAQPPQPQLQEPPQLQEQ